MALIGYRKTIRNVRFVNANQMALIRAYLKGMVYSWCASRGVTPFAARDILGGVNNNWTNTPLHPLYDHYARLGYSNDKAINLAGRAVGWILMRVLADDDRTFHTYTDYVRKYEWVN